MSRHQHQLLPEAQVELLRRHYLQLTDPRQLPLPPPPTLKAPEIQARIYKDMFRNDGENLLPPPRYRLRALKRILNVLERAVADADPEESV